MTGVPAWAGFGSTRDSHMYMQRFEWVPKVCDVALLYMYIHIYMGGRQNTMHAKYDGSAI